MTMRRATTVSAGRRPPSSTSAANVRKARSVAPLSSSKSVKQQSSGNKDSTCGDDMEAIPEMEATMTAMSVVEAGAEIAFAAYNEERNEIIIDHSHANGHDTQDVVEQFINISRPNLVLVSNKIAGNTPLLHLLTRPNPSATTTSTNTSTKNDSKGDTKPVAFESKANNRSIPYRILKSSAFDIRKCRSLILNNLRVLALLRNNDHQLNNVNDYNFQKRQSQQHQKNRNFSAVRNCNAPPSIAPSTYHALASIIDFESSIQVRALGALLSFLQDTLFRLEEGSSITVNTVRRGESSMFMRIDAATLSALHIFATEHHPLVSKGRQSGNSKEGFSLFSLLDRTKSKAGTRLLKEWMLKPLLSKESISKRHDGVQLFLQSEFQTSVGVLLNVLESIGAVTKILLRMQKCHTSPMDFLVLSRTLDAALSICHTLTIDFQQKLQLQQQQNFLIFIEGILKCCCVPVLRDLQKRITSIIDEEQTLQAKTSVVVQNGFHEDLDAAKEHFENLDEMLSSIANQIFERHPELVHIKVIFLPQVGFLVSLDKRQHPHDVDTNHFPGVPEDFDHVFSQGDDAFFKNREMKDMDENVGDLDAYITDTEHMIVSELEEDILDCESELRSTFSALAELDCVLAFATCAADLKFTRPEVVDADQRTIIIKNGRHPLQELIIEGDFIANDTVIDATNRVNIITGPNFSGKSCYTRQVGILVYMAQIGSFLPCDTSTVSITDQLFARISSVETCAIPQSTFQLDLTQMATILRRSTPSSLVLVDEFGKGTSPASGIAVLTSAMRRLSRIQCKCICTTHFLEIFSLGLLKDGLDGIKVLRMAVHLPESQDDGAVPLFRLENGVANSSAGLLCAESAGVKEKIITRATQIINALRVGGSVKPLQESMHSSTIIPKNVKAILRMFLGIDSWKTASEQELLALQHALSRG